MKQVQPGFFEANTPPLLWRSHSLQLRVISLKPEHSKTPTKPSDLCLRCGLCCDGSIFADVKLVPGDDAEFLAASGLPLVAPPARPQNRKSKPDAGSWRFFQPCAAFDGCRCRVYAVRPQHCRQFECLVLKALESGRVEWCRAERLVRSARRKARTVDRLLRSLGETEQKDLASRFRSLARRYETEPPTAKAALVFGRLTVLFHQLNVLLQEHFYSGPL